MRKIVLLCVLLLLINPAVQAQEEAILIWVDWGVPAAFDEMLAPLLALERYEQVNNREEADLEVTITGGGGAITSRWIYVPVVAFPTYADSISFADLRRYWEGDATALNGLSMDGSPAQLIVTRDVLDAMNYFLGEPADGVPMQLVPDDALVGQLWEQRTNAWTMLPFDELTPDVRALKLDGTSPFSDDFDLLTYPFVVRIGITGEEQAVGRAIDDLLFAGTWRGTNRNPERLTRVVLSGVTALTRATAHAMETYGITLPAQHIMPFVEDAHLLHTSNEVPFSEICPPPDPYGGTIFCASDQYMQLLQYIGLDVVELTGNHINDYGPGALGHTLEMYDEAEMQYFGGGRTPEEARAPLLLEHNDNTIAFIGCNMPGPFKAWVGEDKPGAAPCDDAYLEQELARLASDVDIVIMTVQDYEYYRYNAPNVQINRFTNYANWGADVVIGSQAHQPQGFTFVPREGQPSSFLHHGLGNLFFDQMANIGTRQMFMDKLIIYEGRLLNIELFTGLIEDYCCPRPMTLTERAEFLQTIFTASGW